METWVQTLGAEWEAAYGGVAPYKQLGRYCKPLLAKYPFSQVQIHLRHYLAAHHDREARFSSPARFAQTFLEWGPSIQNAVWLPYQPVSKTVVETVGQRSRLIQVDISDPRPGV